MNAKSMLWGAAITIAAFALGSFVGGGKASAETSSAATSEPGILAFTMGDRGRELFLVMPQEKRIMYYRLEGQNLRLWSVRNFEWDAKLEDYNIQGISPKEIMEQWMRAHPDEMQ